MVPSVILTVQFVCFFLHRIILKSSLLISILDAGWAILVVAIVQLVIWIIYASSQKSSYGFPEVS